jgi:hypothetical protein
VRAAERGGAASRPVGAVAFDGALAVSSQDLTGRASWYVRDRRCALDAEAEAGRQLAGGGCARQGGPLDENATCALPTAAVGTTTSESTSPKREAGRRGVAWRGVAWRGVAWRGVAWRGEARRGEARRGVAWRGVAWRGSTLYEVVPEIGWRPAAHTTSHEVPSSRTPNGWQRIGLKLDTARLATPGPKLLGRMHFGVTGLQVRVAATKPGATVAVPHLNVVVPRFNATAMS